MKGNIILKINISVLYSCYWNPCLETK